MPQGFAAATSLLLIRGWEVRSSGSIGEMWGKGVASTPVPFDLEPSTLGWQQFVSDVARVEHESARQLEADLKELLAKSRVRRRKQSRTELDLRLGGIGVRGHETSARHFGKFVTALTASVGNLVMDQFGLPSYQSKLQILGAKAGSVRIQLREPPMDRQDEALFQDAPDTAESLALTRLVQILNTAEDAAQAPIDDRLDAVLDLGRKARNSLGEVATQIYQAGWRVDGQLLGFDDVRTVAITPAGAWRLRDAVGRTSAKVTTREIVGTLDAWRWSKASMELLREGERTMRIVVPIDLQERVAELNRTKGQIVSARIQVFERETPSSEVASVAYALLAIEPFDRLV